MAERVDVDINELFRCSVEGLVAHPVIVLNGCYHADNDVSELPEGVLCCSMAEARERYPQLINRPEFTHSSSLKRETASLRSETAPAESGGKSPQSGATSEERRGKASQSGAALTKEETASSKINVASADDAPPQAGAGDSPIVDAKDGVFIFIPEGIEMERPIQIINLLYGLDMLLSAEQRNCIVVGRGAKVSLLVCDHTITGEPAPKAHNSDTISDTNVPNSDTASVPKSITVTAKSRSATTMPATPIAPLENPTATEPPEVPIATKEEPPTLTTAPRFLLENMTEIVLEEGAKVDYIEIESQSGDTSYTNTINFTEERGASLTTMMLSLYGGEICNNQKILFVGERASCNLYGCYIAGEEQKIDNFTYVDHAVPMCTSNELFKGAMDGRSSGNFMGCIRVRRDAQKTEAYQANNNLLLSDTARVNTKPQLIIDADDVKCSHGATIGRIDEEAMFYLRSRGIGEEEARMMMKSAFVYDIIRRIPLEPLRNKVASMVEKRLRGGRDFCENCKIACKK